MIRRLLRNLASLPVVAIAYAAAVQPSTPAPAAPATNAPTTTAAAMTAPATAVTTTPATRPVPKLYGCFHGQGGQSHTSSMVGIPTMFQIEPQWFDAKIAFGNRSKLPLFLDYEEGLSPRPGIATMEKEAAQAQLDAYSTEVGRLLRRMRAESGNDGRLIAAYTDLPMGMKWQYGDDQTAYIEDNRLIAASNPLAEADAMCVHVYLSIDDLNYMTPARAADYARKRIAASRVYNKPIILFISPRWIDARIPTDVPDELLRPLFEVAHAEGVDVCVWNIQSNAIEARRLAQRGKRLFESVQKAH